MQRHRFSSHVQQNYEHSYFHFYQGGSLNYHLVSNVHLVCSHRMHVSHSAHILLWRTCSCKPILFWSVYLRGLFDLVEVFSYSLNAKTKSAVIVIVCCSHCSLKFKQLLSYHVWFKVLVKKGSGLLKNLVSLQMWNTWNPIC